MKARQLKVKVVTAANAAALETAVQGWLDAAGEADIIGDPPIQFAADGTNLHAFLVYAE
jgi:hypothetical protein